MTGDASNSNPSKATEINFGITNIKAYIPIILDLDELNYDQWSELFTVHYGYLTGTTTSTDPDEEWEKRDNLVKLWIYGTISKALVKRVLKKNLKACDVWKNLKDVFHDNKDARAMQLDNDLRNLSIGNLSVTQYFTKIKDMADLLANIEALVSDKSLVTYVVNSLGNKFAHVASIIRNRDPFPTFDTARSMLLVEESILNRETSANSLSSSSSPSVLVATKKGNSQELCRNFIHGSCRFGDRCRFVHRNKPTGDGTKTHSHANSNTKSLNGNNGNHGKSGNMVRMIQTQPATDWLWSPRLQTWVPYF
ncbi:hybrid signal transduction histidine kinase M [Tanacetum coccineum]